MIAYSLKRIALSVPTLLGISILAFLLGILSPGDPAEMALIQTGLDVPTVEQIAAMRHELGLDQPLITQYTNWLFSVLQGDFGQSYANGQKIAVEFAESFPLTLKLAVLSLVFATFFGITAGIAAARYGGKVDAAIKFVTDIMLAVPGFWLALILILIFCENLRLLPTSGSEGWQNFILPAFVLSFSSIGTICRFTRNLLLAEFGKHYFLVARARGIKGWKLFYTYAFLNAVPPIIALLGNHFAGVLGGAVVVESIFAMPGLGSLVLKAIRMRDYPVVQAYVLFTGWVLVAATLAVDLAIAYLNPKVRYGDAP